MHFAIIFCSYYRSEDLQMSGKVICARIDQILNLPDVTSSVLSLRLKVLTLLKWSKSNIETFNGKIEFLQTLALLQNLHFYCKGVFIGLSVEANTFCDLIDVRNCFQYANLI